MSEWVSPSALVDVLRERRVSLARKAGLLADSAVVGKLTRAQLDEIVVTLRECEKWLLER